MGYLHVKGRIYYLCEYLICKLVVGNVFEIEEGSSKELSSFHHLFPRTRLPHSVE